MPVLLTLCIYMHAYTCMLSCNMLCVSIHSKIIVVYIVVVYSHCKNSDAFVYLFLSLSLGELHGLLRNLMKRHPIELQRAITWSQHKSAPYAVLAMSYLIILLKLILGLDDHTEK